ncbi:hypothetical protein D3C79_771130 [compost metagenome]
MATSTAVSPRVLSNSARWPGNAAMMANTLTIKAMVNRVSQGNSHMRTASGLPRATSLRRMHSWVMAITRYISRASAPLVASRNWNTWAGSR